MKPIVLLVLGLSVAACGSQPDRVEDVAANNMATDDVTEVMDESMPADDDGTIGNEDGGNEDGGNEADNAS